MNRKWIALIAVLGILFSLAGCTGSGQDVCVQRADRLMQDGQNGQRFAGMVVSENVVNIRRDTAMTLLECFVEAGQQVKAGDPLFAYDTESMSLELEKQQLELEKLKSEQETYAKQQATLEKELKRANTESQKVQLTLEINVLKTTQLENTYTILAKEQSIERIQEILANAQVDSPVDGVIRELNEDEGAQYYIVIQQQGAYRIKGSLNEMNIGSLTVGARFRAISRLDDSVFWTGTVTEINTDEPTQDQYNPWGGMMDGTTTSSNYVFYGELDSVEGLLLGQHVYVECMAGTAAEGLWIPDAFMVDMDMDEQTGALTAKVWVANASGRLEKRTVELGAYDDLSISYEVLSGITGEDYLADPFDPACTTGAHVSYRDRGDFTGALEG